MEENERWEMQSRTAAEWDGSEEGKDRTFDCAVSRLLEETEMAERMRSIEVGGEGGRVETQREGKRVALQARRRREDGEEEEEGRGRRRRIGRRRAAMERMKREKRRERAMKGKGFGRISRGGEVHGEH